MYLSGLDEVTRVDSYTTIRSLGAIMKGRVQGAGLF